MAHKVGEVLSHDFQADIFEGRYRLVEHVGRNRWVVEALAPDEAEMERIMEVYTAPGNGIHLGYHDPFGPERRPATVQEAFDREVAERVERAGQRSEIEFISAARYAEYF